ncbi:MAG TPA: chemotaxis protein CheW [Polyangiales bacterium]|nr:chemotaxis protein CheW [Polyangiales bacterium]
MSRLNPQHHPRPALDWQRARERLAQLGRGVLELDAAAQQRVLEERARLLARPQHGVAALQLPAANDRLLALLHFELGSERFAVETRFVHQIMLPGELTRVPGAPSQLRGVTNLRGEILPVFELRELLAPSQAGAAEAARWLVLGEAEPELCLAVDAVGEISLLERGELTTNDRTELMLGVTADARSVLHGAGLLAHRALFIGDAASTSKEVVP